MARAAKRAEHGGRDAPGFLLITGLSGAGRSEAARSLEDLGYFVVDNLPPALLPKMAELAASPGGPGRVAIVVDARGGVFFGELSKALEELREQRVPSRIVFLDASDEDLVNRYEATRRRHPLAPADRVGEGIRKERLMMESLRADADLVIDTTGLTPHDLRDRMRETFADAPPEAGLLVSVVSFGFKYGSPRDADLVHGRAVPPQPALGRRAPPSPGQQREGARVRRGTAGVRGLHEAARRRSSTSSSPGTWTRGSPTSPWRSGCTGGRHRSVVVADDLAELFPRARASRLGGPPRRRPRLTAPAAGRSRGGEGHLERSKVIRAVERAIDESLAPSASRAPTRSRRPSGTISPSRSDGGGEDTPRRRRPSGDRRSTVVNDASLIRSMMTFRRSAIGVRSPCSAASLHRSSTKRSQKAMWRRTRRRSTAGRSPSSARRRRGSRRALASGRRTPGSARRLFSVAHRRPRYTDGQRSRGPLVGWSDRGANEPRGGSPR